MFAGMGLKNENFAAETLAIYDKLVAGIEGLHRKGATMPYTSVNGHMFSFITKEGVLALRLDAAERETFMKKHKASLCEQHGVVLKEYVVVPDSLIKNTVLMHQYFAASYEYVSSLKPKPAKAKKK